MLNGFGLIVLIVDGYLYCKIRGLHIFFVKKCCQELFLCHERGK
jgi:hypothetical protein